MTADDRNLSAVEIAKLEGQMMAGFADLGGKLDTLIARQEAAEANRSDDRRVADERHRDHEDRIRSLESHDTEDHDARIASLEARKTISPGQLWAAVTSGVTVAGILVGIVSALSGN